MIDILKWQGLIGAFMGAVAPLLLWFFIKFLEKREKYKDDLYYLERTLVSAINNVIDTEETIKNFLDNKLIELLNNIEDRIKENIYSVDIAFLPLFYIFTINESFLNFKTGSGYLDNKIDQIIQMSNNFASNVNDLRKQFGDTIEMNKNMAFYRLNPSSAQNNMYKTNIENFKKTVEGELLEKNINSYLRLLVSARVVAKKISKIGIIRWRFRFSPNFRFFKNREEFEKFQQDEMFDRIDKFFSKEVDTQVDQIKKL